MLLQKILNKQLKLQQLFYKDYLKLSTQDKLKLLKDQYIIGILQEIGEILQCLPYKFWRKDKPITDINYEQLYEELIDVFIYTINCFVLFGFDAKAIYELYNKKYKKIMERYNANNIRRQR